MSELEQHIDDFINGKLSSSDEKAFRLLINKDGELRERVNVYRDLRNVLSDGSGSDNIQKTKRQEEYENLFLDPDGNKVFESINNAENEYFKNSKNIENSFNSRRLIFLLLIAALLLVLYFFLEKRNSSDKIYASLNDYSYLPSLTSRSSQNDLTKGEESFNQERYQEALDYFKVYLDANNETYNSQVELYIACCLLELDQNQNAILQLKKIIASESMDSGIAQWYLVNAYLKNDLKAEAITILELITSDKNNFNYQEALTILTRLSHSSN